MVRLLQSLRWLFKLSDGDPAEWSWDDCGEPPLNQLRPIRNPRSSEKNRHIPVTAYSTTIAGHICLESGLEHDLLRKVDRDPGVRWIVAQPLRLTWAGTKSGSRSARNHTPDLLTVHANGEVTVWDARPEDRADEDFLMKVEVTRRACREVGWRYDFFTGFEGVERLNLLWLQGFRKRPPWADQFEDELRCAVRAGTTLDRLFALDDGTGRGIATVWHLLWQGDLIVDLSARITKQTPVTAMGAQTNA